MATIKDVAREADVSIATVSRIMNNRGAISDKTRKKVYEAMERLHYQPNEMARALQKNKSNIIGLVVPKIDYAFFSRLTDAVEESCHNFGYKLMICKSDENEEREKELVSMLQANQVDGILLCSRLGDTQIYSENMLPLISIDREVEGFSSVTSDNYSGGMKAARELFEAGSRYPLILGTEIPEYMYMDQRYRGFFEECEKKGMKCTELRIKQQNPSQDELVFEFLRVMEKNPGIDGVFMTGDIIAAKIVCHKKIRETGILERMPYIGYDGLEISQLLDITTVSQPIYEIGECAVELLIKKISGKLVQERSILPVRLIERESTLKFKQKKDSEIK